MLVLDAAVRAAHAGQRLSPAIRYSVARLAELLDPETPFALSGVAYCDPLSATRAFGSAARDHLGHPGLRYGTVLAASQLLTDALEQEVNLRSWYPGDLNRLLLFLAQLRKVPNVRTVTGSKRVDTAYGERSAWVRQRLQLLVDGSLARFEAAIEGPGAGYRARLLEDLFGRLAPGPATEREWAELDHDLCYAAALFLGEGRDGRELARSVARGVAAAADDAAAVEMVRRALNGRPAPFQVAVVLTGARSLDRESARSFGVEVVDRGRPRWSPASSAAADAALGDFILECAPAVECTPLLVEVEAWDRGQARVRGLLAAEALQDHLVAGHRRQQFSIKPAVLVRHPATGAVRKVGEPTKPIREGRVPRYSNAAELFPFLRANALARQETSPVLKILHTWIALEYLGRDGAGPPGATARDRRPALELRLEGYLPPHLASVAALAGLRGTLLVSWSELRAFGRRSARRQEWLLVERWLGVAGGQPKSLARFVDLLRALNRPAPAAPDRLEPQDSAPAAAALLQDLARELGPFVSRRLETLGRQLDKGSRLAKAAEGIQVRTVIAIARLKLARHLAVHQGFNAAHASPPLALSGDHMLDSAFEVLWRWMQPGYRASQAMAEARRWHDQNLASWRSVADLVIDGDHLLHPQKR